MFFRKKKDNAVNNIPNSFFLQTATGILNAITLDKLIEQYNSKKIAPGTYVRSIDNWLKIEDVIKQYSNSASDCAETNNTTTPPATDNNDNNVPDAIEQNNRKITCPHCWHSFKISEVLYISKHPDLLGDPIVGMDAALRFSPNNFDFTGHAIDAKGMVCEDMACPVCHLRLPSALTDLNSNVFSIVGAPSCGKSYYLTAMIWQLRKILLNVFDYILTDSDEKLNIPINNYQSILFLNMHANNNVALPKTEIQGNNFSNQIILGDMSVNLPIPFIFTISPIISDEKQTTKMRNFIVYDNAGEQFEPGRDIVTNPATAHLIHSDSIVFLFDVLQDVRFGSKCNEKDPQIAQCSSGNNQLIILNEMILRIRKYAGLSSFQKYDKPLIIVVPKYDAWRQSFPLNIEKENYIYQSNRSLKNYVDIGTIMNVSWQLRTMLIECIPDFVATCESFASTVIFIPVSALGNLPEYDAANNLISIKPKDIKPIWAEVPALIQLAYAGVLEAVDNMPQYDKVIDNYSFTRNSIVCIMPDCNTGYVHSFL